jgi:hypothetical protein
MSHDIKKVEYFNGFHIAYGCKYRKDTSMTDLLDFVIEAHGGLDRFNQFKTISAYMLIGGRLWQLKGQDGVLSDRLRVTVDLHRERTSFAPFRLPNQYAVFTPERIAIETDEREVIEERLNPRAAFAGHTRETPWDNFHLIYFGSYAMWTYLTIPFSLTSTGFEVVEIEPWQEQEETWRRLKVRFPAHIASHSTEQTLYFGRDGLLRRHDYDVEIMGGTPIVHYTSQYKDVAGIKIPTQRRAFIRQPDKKPVPGLLSVSIDLSDIRFE